MERDHLFYWAGQCHWKARDELSGQNPIVRSNTEACFEDSLWMIVHRWCFIVYFSFLFRAEDTMYSF